MQYCSFSPTVEMEAPPLPAGVLYKSLHRPGRRRRNRCGEGVTSSGEGTELIVEYNAGAPISSFAIIQLKTVLSFYTRINRSHNVRALRQGECAHVRAAGPPAIEAFWKHIYWR